jgi:hypothetical protein
MSNLDPLDSLILNLALKHPNLPIIRKVWGLKKVEKLYKIVMMETILGSYHYKLFLVPTRSSNMSLYLSVVS